MSKTTKKLTCKHKFVQGIKKGKLCKKPCRGEFCKDHNKNKTEYLKKYYKTKKTEEKDHKLKELLKEISKANSTDKFNLEKQKLKQLKLTSDRLYLTQQKIGLKKFLGYDVKDGIRIMDIIINNIPKDVANNPDASKEWYDNYYPNKRIYIEFKGTEAQAKKRLKKLEIKIDLLIDKIRQLTRIITAINKRNTELDSEIEI
jgi:hypothetical protein